MTRFSVKLVLSVLRAFRDNSAYEDYQREDGWKDHHYEAAIAELEVLEKDHPDPADVKGRVSGYVLNFLECCIPEMYEAELITRDEHDPAAAIVSEIADTVREIRDRPPPYDPNFGDDRECACGHSYYRHFDSYEDMSPVGCKYCECRRFREKTDVTEDKGPEGH